jgi:D-beta-D-heptose 7-phosphate kinase/D-beta-D-heptose 1-phosphate adenosyltransferase
MLDAIKYVDFVYIFNDETPVKPVEILKPDIVLKGGDYYITRISDDKIR